MLKNIHQYVRDITGLMSIEVRLRAKASSNNTNFMAGILPFSFNSSLNSFSGLHTTYIHTVDCTFVHVRAIDSISTLKLNVQV